MVVATASRAGDLSAGVTAAFVHQVSMESPTEEQRHIMLTSLSHKVSLGMDVNLEKLSKLTTVNDCPAVDHSPTSLWSSHSTALITSKITEYSPG